MGQRDDTRKRRLRQTITVLLAAVLSLILGCDPGMTIRQAVERQSVRGPGVPIPGSATIRVAISRQFIGATWYAPGVTITNSFDSPITVSAVELVAQRITYANKPRRPEAYPLIVAAGQTQTLYVWFDLRDDVQKTFYLRSAELRVHYQKDGREEIAHARIMGGP